MTSSATDVYRTGGHVVCMACDFFYPNTGGVESHLYQLSRRLADRGHRVIIITHGYGRRVGVRYLSGGLKVYYLPYPVFLSQCVLPNVFLTLPLMRWIFVREGVTVVHGHSAFSTLCHDAIFHARTMGLPAVFTDHSLFGFAEVSSVLTNKFLEFTLSDVSQVICVSHTSRENTVLRARIPPSLVSVIPNAVDATVFSDEDRISRFARQLSTPSHTSVVHWVTVVVVSRLVPRKGTDLLAALIPAACRAHPQLRFVVAGDGPRRIALEETRERHRLQDRVELLGAIRHEGVCEVLSRGDIFLNTSLTEAFCIAIIEAACCGLLVVSTNVGGIPEVLPDCLVELADPDVSSLLSALTRSVYKLDQRRTVVEDEHRQRMLAAVRSSYNWHAVAERTERVYEAALRMPVASFQERLCSYYECGTLAGPIFVCIAVLNAVLFVLLEYMRPRFHIDRA